MVEKYYRRPDLLILKDQLYFILDRLIKDVLPKKLEKMLPRPISDVTFDLSVQIAPFETGGRRFNALKVIIYIDLGLTSTILYRPSELPSPNNALFYEHSAIRDNRHSAKFKFVTMEVSRLLLQHGLRTDYSTIHHTIVRNDAETKSTRLSKRVPINPEVNQGTLPDYSTVAFNHVITAFYTPDTIPA